MNTPFPPMDIFSPDDDATIKNLIIYLEEFKQKRDAILQVFYFRLGLFFKRIVKFFNRLEFLLCAEVKNYQYRKNSLKVALPL